MRWSTTLCVLAGALCTMPMALAQEGTEKPEGAITAFAEAIDSQDFTEAFHLLTPEAQKGFWTTVSQGAVAKVFPDAGALDIGVDWPLDEEQAFVAYMEAAAEADALPFSIPALDIAGATVDRAEMAIHLTRTGGEPEILAFQTNKTKKGWRVNKVSWAQTDGETLPWGIR